MKTVQDILDNKDDLIEGTFCYRLFEDGIFDEQMMTNLIEKIEYAAAHGLLTKQVCDTLRWIIDCTEQVFMYHHDKDDLFTISNYTPEIETKWDSVWRERIGLIMENYGTFFKIEL